MNQEFLIKCIKENYVDVNNENFNYFKSKLNDFASVLNKTLGVNSFKFETVDMFSRYCFNGSITLKDGETVVWRNDDKFSLKDLNSVTYHLDLLFGIFSPEYSHKSILYFSLGNYISMNYPDFAAKITMLT
jgi:hypothetical protein